MQAFNSGKKVFFLYPPHELSRNIIFNLFTDGYEVYKLNDTAGLIQLINKFPDSMLFINTDYPYKDFDLTHFNDRILHQKEFENLLVYSFFKEKVSFGDRIKDYISLDRPEKEIYGDLSKILLDNKAHGKREYVRYGNYDEILSTISFACGKSQYEASMHDISPKALSFSHKDNLEDLIDNKFTAMKLKVGTYEIEVEGHINSHRMIGDKKIYIAVFETDDNKRDEIFNFIFTSLEKGMDEMIHDFSD